MKIAEDNKSDFEGIILIKCKNQSPENVSATLEKIINSGIMGKIKNSLFILNERELIIILENKFYERCNVSLHYSKLPKTSITLKSSMAAKNHPKTNNQSCKSEQ